MTTTKRPKPKPYVSTPVTLDPDPLLLDVLRGAPAPECLTLERRALRERLEGEAIRAAGGIVEIPPENP